MWTLRVLQIRYPTIEELANPNPILMFEPGRTLLLLHISFLKHIEGKDIPGGYGDASRANPDWGWPVERGPVGHLPPNHKEWRGWWAKYNQDDLQKLIDMANKNLGKITDPPYPPFMRCTKCNLTWGWHEDAPNKLRTNLKCPKCKTESKEVIKKPKGGKEWLK